MKNYFARQPSVSVRHGYQTIASLLLAIASGCGGDAGPKMIPVRGTVTLDGQPLAKVSLGFHPDEAKGNKFPGLLPGGYTDDSGAFEVMTTSRSGAPAGWYKVVVTPQTAPPGGEAPKVVAPPFNKKYASVNSTDLSVEVKEDAQAGHYDLKVTK